MQAQRRDMNHAKQASRRGSRTSPAAVARCALPASALSGMRVGPPLPHSAQLEAAVGVEVCRCCTSAMRNVCQTAGNARGEMHDHIQRGTGRPVVRLRVSLPRTPRSSALPASLHE